MLAETGGKNWGMGNGTVSRNWWEELHDKLV